MLLCRFRCCAGDSRSISGASRCLRDSLENYYSRRLPLQTLIDWYNVSPESSGSKFATASYRPALSDRLVTIKRQQGRQASPACSHELTFLSFVDGLTCGHFKMHSTRSDVEPVDSSLVPLITSEIHTWTYAVVSVLTILVYDTNILLMRVLALYFQDKRLAVYLRTIFSLGASVGIGFLIFGNIYAEISIESLAEGVTVCAENRSPPRFWRAVSWAAPLLYGIILMVLALHKAAQHWRESNGFGHSNLVKVLIQDQAIYFVLVVFFSVMKVVAGHLRIPNLLLANLLAVLGGPSILSVLGSHLLVNMKEAGERGANGGPIGMGTVSSMGFS
ncbi:hypothetical protein DFH11DRAFT_1515423 [Phellopilus nigrolimitatus]|nr:hypothetical protein DFH11DRAFT_1515423 [Phellopilus nigrolimitatus]